MRWFRPSLLLFCFLAAAGFALAAGGTTVWVGPGSSTVQYAGYDILVETTDDVIVTFEVVDGAVVGSVSTAPSTRVATVRITLVDDPDRVIFEGKVVADTWFADYFPHETGRGEQ